MKWALILLSFFVFQVHGATYQFQGTYYDHTGPNTCRRLEATARLELTEQGSFLSIEAPGATCEVPTFSDGTLPLRVSVFPNYSVNFKGQSACTLLKQGTVYMEYAEQNGEIIKPIIYIRQGHWHQTIFEVGQHTVVRPCN